MHRKASGHSHEKSSHSAWRLAQEGQPWWGLFLAPGGAGDRHLERGAAMVALPPVHYSTVVPCFYGILGFLHKHSQLWISSLPSPQAVCSQPTAVLSEVCSPISTFHLSAPVCTRGHMSQSWVLKAVAQTVCVGLTLSCLP